MYDYKEIVEFRSCNSGCGTSNWCMCDLAKNMADEIERLREAIRQADYVFELLAPENHSQTTDSELASLLSSVREKLSEMVATWDNAALGEKE